MSFWLHLVSVFRRKKLSAQRRGMLTAVIEGIPATIIGNLLGGPMLTIYIVYLGGSAEDVGLAVAIPQLANMIQIAAAFLMQRFDNRRLLMTVLGAVHRTLWVSTGLIPFFVSEELRVPVFIGLFLVASLAASTGSMFWTSIIADMVPKKVRGSYFGVRNTIHWAIASLSLLVGGQILNRYDEETGFMIVFGICAACAVWNVIELWRYPNLPFERSPAASSSALFSKPFKDSVYMKATLFISLFVLLQNIAIPLFSYVMLEILDISKWLITVITTVQMLVMMFSYYYWGTLNTRVATRTLLLWTLPIISLSCLLWAGIEWLPVVPVLIVVHAALGFGLGGFSLLIFNFIIGDTPKSDRPMYVAVYSALSGLTGFVGPLLGGFLYKLNEHGPFWLRSYGLAMLIGAAMLTLALTVGPLVLQVRTRRAR